MNPFWNIPRRGEEAALLDEGGLVKSDVDSIVVIGRPSKLTWIKPRMEFRCDLRRAHASPWKDKKTKESLRRREALAEPPGYCWAEFPFGGQGGQDSLKMYCLTKMELHLSDLRKRFFEEHVFPAFRKVKNEARHDDSSSGVLLEISSSSASYPLRIHPDSFGLVCEKIQRSLEEKPLRGVRKIYAGYTCHGLKNNLETITRERLIEKTNAMVHANHEDVLFWQIHVATTINVKGQLVTANESQIYRELKRSNPDLHFYECFDLPGTGGFTLAVDPFNRPLSEPFQDVCYLQLYVQNQHLLMKQAKSGKCSLAMNAALGCPTRAEMREFYQEFVEEDDDVFEELRKHVDNCLERERQLKCFIGSILNNATCRFEVVYEGRCTDDFFPAREQQACVVRRTRELFGKFCDNGCILLSKGTWWRDKVLEFREEILLPYLDTLNHRYSPTSSSSSSCSQQQWMRKIYDLEQIAYHWIGGPSNNRLLDYGRIKFLKTIRPAQGCMLPQRESDGIAYADCSQWMDLNVVYRFKYMPFMRNHFRFLFNVPPQSAATTSTWPTAEEVPSSLLPGTRLFVSFFTTLCKFCQITWDIGAAAGNGYHPQQQQQLCCFGEKAFAQALLAAAGGNKKSSSKFVFSNKLKLSVKGVLDSMLRPSTVMGQVLLTSCLTLEALKEMKSEGSQLRAYILAFVATNVRWYPAYMINDRLPINSSIQRRWATWLEVTSNSQVLNRRVASKEQTRGLKRPPAPPLKTSSGSSSNSIRRKLF